MFILRLLLLMAVYSSCGCGGLLSQVSASASTSEYTAVIGVRLEAKINLQVYFAPQEGLYFMNPKVVSNDGKWIAEIQPGTTLTIDRIQRKHHFEFGQIDYLMTRINVGGVDRDVVVFTAMGGVPAPDKVFENRSFKYRFRVLDVTK